MQKELKKIFFPVFILVISCILFTGCGSSPLELSPGNSLPGISIRFGSETKKSPETADTEDEVPEEEKNDYDGTLQIKDGLAEPMLNYSTPDTSNDQSDILRFCVYVETDHDTDGDGMNDLVKAFIQVPKSAVEGKYKAAVIYDPTPYCAGTTENFVGSKMFPYAEDGFDYEDLYKEGDVRIADEEDTMTAALKSDPSEWSYTTPKNSPGFYKVSLYDYFLIRGFAVVEACGIGTYGSEGFELCGMDLERDSHKCVIEWLTGDRAAFIDKEGTKSIEADWCNKNVAMTGVSYGGTLPFEVATTGVKGLKTIIPVAGIANWYDYTNSQGICTYGTYNYTDSLAAYNSGALYLDDNWRVMNDSYSSFLRKIAADQIEAKGLFAPVWQMMDYSDKYEAIDCSALIVHGLNDFNVSNLQAEMMYNAFKKAGKEAKLILHQDAHNVIYGHNIGDNLYEEILNRWLCHYLYGEENGAEDMPELSVQSNVDGSFALYDTFPDTKNLKLLSDDNDETKIYSNGFEGFYNEYVDSYKVIDRYYLEQDKKHVKVFDLETDNENDLTFIGSCEVHVDLKTDDTNMENMMVTAVLLDTDEKGDSFKAYITGNTFSDILPKKTVGSYEFGGGHEDGQIYEYVQSPTDVKAVAYGWTNLLTPDRGKSASEYTEKSAIAEDTYYGYNIYLKPTVYTLRPGHKLKLALLAQDPQRVLMDEIQNDDTPYYIDDYEDPGYSFTVDEGSLAVKLDIIK